MNPEIAKRREYLVARKVRGGERLTIGFTGIADFRSFIGQEYIAGILKAAEDYDINFINMCEAVKYSLFDDIDFISHYSKKFRFMRAPLIDGLITWASSLAGYLSNEEIIEQFSALKPLPMVDIGYLDIPGVTALRIDNSCSMQLIVEHLSKVHGYKRIAFFGCRASRPHQERLNSFKKALERYSLSLNPEHVFMADSLEEADIIHAVDELSAHVSALDAIVTSSDIIASTLIAELEKRGVHVPEDVAVTGFNNQYQGITARTPVTTINLEYFKRGYMAVEQLISQIMNPERDSRVLQVPTSLIVRESCGCFEQQILDAGKHSQKDAALTDDSSEEEGRNFLFTQVNSIFSRESHERKTALVNAVFTDLYEQTEPAKTLQWFRQFLHAAQSQGIDAEQKITLLRRALLVLCGSDEKQKQHMEDICSQLRVLCAVTADYERLAERESSYRFNNVTQAAIHFASATNGKEMQNALKAHLGEFGIPGIVLSLSDNMTTDLETSNVELIIPEPIDDIRVKLPYRVHNEALFPKFFFPKNQRYSVVLEILHYSDRYFGFAFMQMHSRDIALYDSVRLLLCHALYTLYLREGRTKEHSMLLNTEQLEGILSLSNNSNPDVLTAGKLTVHQITSYMLDHISEMTSLDKMAQELGVSKSKLVRQTKSLTGYSVQSLHEKLKMELAKTMLTEGRLKLSEIAERLGFQNGNYFSNVFKKNFGESPRSWAKAQKK